MIGVAHAGLLCHAAAMTSPTPMAGGFFLIVPIVAGFIWGLATGQAMSGAIAGLGVGLVLALIVWLVDRLRQRR
jgi:membrane associated rhomboid family serine protease